MTDDDPDEKEAFFKRAIALQEELAAEDPLELGLLVQSYNNLGDVQQLRELSAAKHSYERALDCRIKLVRSAPENEFARDDLAQSHDLIAFLVSLANGLEVSEIVTGPDQRVRQLGHVLRH